MRRQHQGSAPAVQKRSLPATALSPSASSTMRQVRSFNTRSRTNSRRLRMLRHSRTNRQHCLPLEHRLQSLPSKVGSGDLAVLSFDQGMRHQFRGNQRNRGQNRTRHRGCYQSCPARNAARLNSWTALPPFPSEPPTTRMCPNFPLLLSGFRELMVSAVDVACPGKPLCLMQWPLPESRYRPRRSGRWSDCRRCAPALGAVNVTTASAR